MEVIHEVIKDIIEYNPLEGNYLKVAQLGSYQVNGLNSSKDTNTVLISANLISKIKPSHINVPVKSTGRNYNKEFIYKPSFSIYLSPALGLKKAEPLVVSWDSGNYTVLAPDQGFLQTYGLIPRFTQEITYWDDRSKPAYNIVENKPNSFYDFPDHSEAYVKLNQEYLQDYLFLRKKIAVFIFQEKRNIETNDKIDELLGDEGYYIFETDRYEVRFQRHSGKDRIVQLEVNGFRILFDSNELNEYNSQSSQPIGHTWKGIDGLVTAQRARHHMPFEYVYVSDDVLEKYEDDESYELYPETGSVHYGIHWSVSYCERVGRNAIKIELKKLYEGTPYEVIDYWNQFSIDVSTINKNEKNIAARAKNICRRYFLFGRLMSGVLNNITNLQASPSQIIWFDELTVKNEGILQNSKIQPIAYHISYKSFTKNQFISRCKELHKLLIENLSESMLRKCVNQLGFDTEKTKQFKSVKLLDLILSYLGTAEESGLDPKENSKEIISRLDEKPKVSLVRELFALNDLRQLDAHKSDQSFKKKLTNSLQVFDIDPNSITNNYALACDQVYDKLDNCFIEINHFLNKYSEQFNKDE